ncbi:MAG TPA: YceI family protein [Chitinophagaceae bacterium]|nr:YceI family protein [Chitinophagaceae bacterium]
MLSRILTVLAGFTAVIASGQAYTPADAGSKVRFVIKNFGINTGGTFEGLTGSITFDPANLALSSFDVSVEAKTVDTDIEARDNHLRKPEYFDVEKFPKLIFKSTKVTTTNKPEYLYMFGTITIKGVSKEIGFPFTQKQKDGGYLFEGEFKLNRLDFGVGGTSFSLGDELTVNLSIFAKKN